MVTAAIVLATVLLILATSLISYRITSRKKTTENDWAIAGNSLPLYVVVGTQFASAMGGGVLVAHVGNAYTNGVGHLLYGVLASLPFICLIYLAKWIRRNNYSTIPEILRSFTDGNKVVTVIAAIMTIIVPYGWITSQITAFGSIYSRLTGMDYNMICIIFAAVSLLFVMPAGLKTVAWTDFIFSCFMIAMCVISLVWGYNMAGGASKIAENLNEIDPNLLSFSGSLSNNIGLSAAMLWIFAVLPGGLTNQIYFQRICAIDSEDKVNSSLMLSGLLSMLSFVWAISMGLIVRSVNPGVPGSGATAWFMGQLPLFLTALFAALIFATMMSTVSSGVQASVINITRDILPVIAPDMTEEKKLTISRVLSVVIMVIAILMCLVFTDTLTWLTATYAYSAAALACPVFLSYALRDKNFVTTQGVIAGMVFGIVGCGIANAMNTKINYAAIGIAISFVAMIVVCAMTKKKAAA